MMDFPADPPSPEQRQQAIQASFAACGLDPAGLTYEYDEDSYIFYITIMPASGVSAEHFPCIHEAAGFDFVRFDPPDLAGPYNAYVREAMRPELLAQAEEQLKARRLWAGFPAREAYGSFAAYLEALEAHAGVAPGTWLKAEGEGRIIFTPPIDALTIDTLKSFEKTQETMLMVVFHATARDRTEFGFFGNDKVRE
ncbi:hypothetical protein GVM20_14455 [Porphyrobacter sp. SLTP]|uniref:hypothetical protein n=1 Tax=Porphyrobacter sp. SLTP TaxID=2683266 RepID=UPI0014128862|nr:hypothetical protein [Porphyrobacter sp. SLTP]NBB26331.1 hypothetical protein [Porphyrobacter sp. SLTP]